MGPESPFKEREIMEEVLTACDKHGHGNHVRSLHELSKSASLGEGYGRTKAFSNFLCIWRNKKQALHLQATKNGKILGLKSI